MSRQLLNLRQFQGELTLVSTLWFLLSVCGCGGSGQDTLLIRGEVTLDGSPVKDGVICISSTDSVYKPVAIRDGQYDTSDIGGITKGTYRVEIEAYREAAGAPASPLLPEGVAQREQFLPLRYNAESELTLDVDSEGPLVRDFRLTSDERSP